MKRTLLSLFILFVTICQLYVGRLVRDTYKIIIGDGSNIGMAIFPMSKAIQVIGIVVALTFRVHEDIAANIS
jgi:hypothetical protein